ncbi:phospholipid carrier-dependent glycosyltransferase [Candidatus Dojkabacteria bacterium]|nr:phospholipid carrier-dependent glycosyltransferase [Candidatus Dojkabacteria bacterium]
MQDLLKKLKRNKFAIAKCIVFGLFILTAYFMVFTVREGTSPDENYHLNLSAYFYKNPGYFFNDTESIYAYSGLSRAPRLYHYLMGLLTNFNIYHIPLILYLRVFNPLLALGSLYFLYKIAKEITKDKWASLFTVFLLANTLMFTFVSGFANYDNLVNLAAYGSVYYLIRYRNTRSTKILLLFFIFNLVGTLTKSTFVPISFILYAIFGISFILPLKGIKERVSKTITGLNLKHIANIVYLLLFSFLLALNLELYLGNIIQYHSINPSCDKVLSHEICYSHSGTYKRNYDFENNASSLPEAKPLPNAAIDWSRAYTKSILGILGHRPSFFNKFALIPFAGVGILGLIGFAIKRKVPKNVLILAVISVSFTCVVFLYNYSEYRTFHRWVAIQGRYLLPIVGLLYAIASYYIFQIPGKFYRNVLLLLIALAVFYTSTFEFLRKEPPYYKTDWAEIADKYNHYNYYLED